ncbi:hypothetical protein [Prauserella muralis]|uniref:Uncharacterized protein n=1 Tax=Prauserella muralis TaxID=588067 RepID=A0A2V4BAG9_9PSEU|nr:hypothetical protein [Prauserella muralis]PXY31109.1 hypothetical protein BAY60_01455 [Prauserella muralis]TWE14602.1 hypothetical protein FHX69_6759 [Prauserella muralis]
MGRYRDHEDLTRWVSAFHEAGHAVVHCAAGGRLRTARLTADDAGHITTRENGPHPDRPLDWLAMLLAGHEAATRFLVQHGGYSTGQARSRTRGSARDDLAAFRRDARGTGISESRARREAATRVRRHWGRIQRAAHTLHATGRLTTSRV